MNTLFHRDVSIPAGKVTVKGELIIPAKAKAIIIFSHGSGSSRFSKRNQRVAQYLHEKNFGTLLFDLLTEEEDKYYYNRFNIDLLAKRLADATEWLGKLSAAKDCCIGYFGFANFHQQFQPRSLSCRCRQTRSTAQVRHWEMASP